MTKIRIFRVEVFSIFKKKSGVKVANITKTRVDYMNLIYKDSLTSMCFTIRSMFVIKRPFKKSYVNFTNNEEIRSSIYHLLPQ